jgi:glycosyltransferase involved in cell wall biosynthesis
MLSPAISVIILAFNEELTIDNVIFDTISVMDCFGMQYEMIFIDDMSTIH